MKIYLDNVNLGSSSGPNSFARKLKDSLLDMSHSVTDVNPDVQISFIFVYYAIQYIFYTEDHFLVVVFFFS